MKPTQHIKGRGAQQRLFNSFSKQEFTTEWDEGVDEYTHLDRPSTQIFYEHPKKISNKVSSPDVGMEYSINPDQGCEHGCVYCYARNSHEMSINFRILNIPTEDSLPTSGRNKIYRILP